MKHEYWYPEFSKKIGKYSNLLHSRLFQNKTAHFIRDTNGWRWHPTRFIFLHLFYWTCRHSPSLLVSLMAAREQRVSNKSCKWLPIYEGTRGKMAVTTRRALQSTTMSLLVCDETWEKHTHKGYKRSHLLMTVVSQLYLNIPAYSRCLANHMYILLTYAPVCSLWIGFELKYGID